MTWHNITQNRKITSRAIISALALWLAFCGMAAAEQLYVNEDGWWRDGGAFNASETPISAAVGAAGDGDAIYVWNGSYNENVNVYKRLTLEGEGADVVTVTGAPTSDIFEVTADWVNISGFTVRGATGNYVAGIYLGNVDYCDISENNASENHHGIYLESSSSNTIENNTANSNSMNGICLYHSSSNTLMNNTANSNDWGGIYLESYSSSNTLMNNTASNNAHGIRLESYSSSNTIENNTASNNHCGIFLLYWSNYNTLMSNTANSNGCGIYLMYSRNNIITCNWVQNNTVRGFYLRYATSNNISYNNIIENGNYNTETGGWEWNFYNDQPDTIEAKHNYWGAGMNSSTIDASIYGRAKFYPFETEPAPCAPTPEESHTFTTADAVIALQIAVGSRPPDLCWDVSGDGSVTSLDALMILQAAAGSIEIG